MMNVTLNSVLYCIVSFLYGRRDVKTQKSRLNYGIQYKMYNKKAALKLISRWIIFEVFQFVWKTYLNVTDRHSVRQTDDILWYCGITALA